MIAKEVAKTKLLICSLQEVRYRNNGHKVVTLDTGESYAFLWCGRKKRRDAGVGVLIKLCKSITFEDPDFSDPRLMALNIEINGFKIRLVNCYAPTNCDGTDHQKDLFYRMLRKASKKQYKHQKLIVNGDFNATTSVSLKQCYFDGKKVIEDDLCNDNGFRLKSFCKEFQLCISQTYFDQPLENRYTWYSGDQKTKKVIDYVLIEPYAQNYVNKCFVSTDSDFESDHRMIVTNLSTPMTKRARWKQKKKQCLARPDIKSLNNIEISKTFVTKVTDDLVTSHDMETTSSKIINCLKKVADETLPKKGKTSRENEVWKNDKSLNSLLNERKSVKKDSHNFKTLTRQIKKRVRQLRNDKFAKEAAEINELVSYRKVEELYRSFKSDNSSFSDAKTKKKCDLNKLKDYFKHHFTSEPINHDPIELEEVPEFIAKLQATTIQIDTGAPSKNEIVNTIKKMKNGKSASDVPIELIKHSLESQEFVDEITKLYKTIWTTKAIPTEWGHSKLVTLWKGPGKGKANDPKTYRGIQIGSSLCKILITIIIGRLKDWYEQQLLDQQQGFRSARGTTDGIFIAKSIQQITDKMKKLTPILFVDLTAAFDHVERKWLFKTLEKRFKDNDNNNVIEILKAIYSYTTTALMETPDDKFELNVGVRQGGPESPMLYNLFMDFIMRIFIDECKKSGVKFLKLKFDIPESGSHSGKRTIGDFYLDWCGYADDLLLVFEDIKSLRRGIELLDEVFKRYRLKINISKTKTMVLNHQYLSKDYPSSISSLRGIDLGNVKSYPYLGCEIKFDEPNTGDTELNLRTDAAECKFYSLSRNMMNMKIRLRTRIQMLNSLVRSTIAYSCQTWNITKAQMNRLNSQYSAFVRKMTKGGYKRKPDSWRFIYTNAKLLSMAQTSDLASYVRRQQRNYLGHIVRKDNSSIVKRLMFNSDPSKRPGRQLTLNSSVLASERCTPDELYTKAMNRDF